MASTRILPRRSGNTSVVTINGITVVTYHKTPVVSFNGDAVLLDTGGYQSAMTKTRMNQAAYEFGLNYQVFQAKGQWWVDTVYGRIPFRHRRLMLPREVLPREGPRDRDTVLAGLLAAYRDDPTIETALVLSDRLTELGRDGAASAWRAFARDAQALYAFHGNDH